MLKQVLGSCRAATPTSGQRPLPPHGGEEISVCQSQLDLPVVLVSIPRKRIALVELCRPMDGSLKLLSAAHVRKQCIYRQLMEVLWLYLEGG